MKRPVQQLHFHATYWYASVVRDVLYDRFAYLHELEGFYCDNQYLGYIYPYARRSAVHSFIAYVVDWKIREEQGEYQLEQQQKLYDRCVQMSLFLGEEPQTLPIEFTMRRYGITHTTFFDELVEAGRTFANATQNDLDEYYSDLWLSGEYDTLIDRTSEEVFYLLFQNREVLLVFNEMLAGMIAKVDPTKLEKSDAGRFASPGVLCRVSPPAWAQRAVFFRDRGMCALCRTDLSGTLNISPAEHYDHIVPLARGGLNDVSNIQLLCASCNLKKRDGQAITSRYYEMWYEMND